MEKIALKFSTFLDNHLALLFIEEHCLKAFKSTAELKSKRLEILKNTALIEKISVELKSNPKAFSEDFISKCKKTRSAVDAETNEIMKLLDSNDLNELGVINRVLDFASNAYDCGLYKLAYKVLYICTEKANSDLSDMDCRLKMLWGNLACLIILQHSGEEISDVDKKLSDALLKVRDAIEAHNHMDMLKKLLQRVWLCHWSVFLFKFGEQCKRAISELLWSPAYINAMQTISPYMLRYLTAITIISSKKSYFGSENRKKQINELVKVLHMENSQQRSILSSLVMKMFFECDFDSVPGLYVQGNAYLDSDFFLKSCKEEILKELNALISYVYSRIYLEKDAKSLLHNLSIEYEGKELEPVKVSSTTKSVMNLHERVHSMIAKTH